MPISQKKLKEYLQYDPITGYFKWIKKPHPRITVGWSIRGAGSGYVKITLFDKTYTAHRLAWLYMTGEWPINEIDHVDGNPANNKWENLRQATRSENAINSMARVKGICWHKRQQKYMAYINWQGVRKHIGYFDTSEDAYAAYRKEAEKYHGEFARLV